MKKRTVSKVARFAIATAFAFSAPSAAYANHRGGGEIEINSWSLSATVEAEAALLLPAVQTAR